MRREIHPVTTSNDPILTSGDRLVGVKVASAFLGISPRTLRRQRTRLDLRPILIGGRCLYRVSDLHVAINSRVAR
jgi:hypothetical protein